MNTLLITGATGTIGSELARQLSARGASFRALVRTLDARAAQLAALPGAEVVVGDFRDSSSLHAALEGIEKAFLLTHSSEEAEAHQLAFVRAAKEAGVQHVVKLSQLAAAADSPVRFLRYHARVEEALRDSGMDWTFLRPNLFMQALLGFRQLIAEKGVFFATAGDAPVSLIDIRDIAAVAAEALTTTGHEGKTYDLTGPEPLTHGRLAEILSEELGKPVHYINVTEGELLPGLLAAGFPEWQAEGLLEDYAHYARGEASGVSPAVQHVTGVPARTFRAFVAETTTLFSGK